SRRPSMLDQAVATVGAPSGRERLLRGAHVASVAAALPGTVVSNAEVAARLRVDEDWIYTRTGVRERRRLATGESVTGLACAAARRAVAAADVDPVAIDLVLVATCSAEDV